MVVSDNAGAANVNCATIGDSLVLQTASGDPTSLTDLSPLNGVKRICGSLQIQNLPVTTLAGLEGIEFVGGDLQIRLNGNLESLVGLENLAYVGGTVTVELNNAIDTLADSVMRFKHAVVGNPGGSVIKYYPAGAEATQARPP